MKKFLIILLAISLCLMAASLTLAADSKTTKTTAVTKTSTKTADSEGKLGVGWYEISYGHGLSVNYKMSKTLSVQGILAPLGWEGFYGGKANFKFFTPDPSIGVYGYGLAGLTNYYWANYLYSGSSIGFGFGGGVGAEYFPGKMFDLGNDNYKKVGFMVELGLDNLHYSYDGIWDYKPGVLGISFNAGAHYYF